MNHRRLRYLPKQFTQIFKRQFTVLLQTTCDDFDAIIFIQALFSKTC